MSASKSQTAVTNTTDYVYNTTTTTTTNVGDIGLTGDQIVHAIDTIGNMGVLITDTLSSRLISAQRENAAQLGDVVARNQAVAQTATNAGVEAQAVGAQLQALALKAKSVDPMIWVYAGGGVLALVLFLKLWKR